MSDNDIRLLFATRGVRIEIRSFGLGDLDVIEVADARRMILGYWQRSRLVQDLSRLPSDLRGPAFMAELQRVHLARMTGTERAPA